MVIIFSIIIVLYVMLWLGNKTKEALIKKDYLRLAVCIYSAPMLGIATAAISISVGEFIQNVIYKLIT